MTRKYKPHKYTWQRPFTSTQHRWEFVGPRGGVSLNVSLTDGYDPSAGLDFHHTSGDGAPDHIDCRVTGGQCWHDGTSLYAAETVWPHIKGMCEAGDHGRIFSYLETIADGHFQPGEL